MSLWQRLKNLWRLSEIAVETEERKEVLQTILPAARRAKVVDMRDPLDIDLGNE